MPKTAKVKEENLVKPYERPYSLSPKDKNPTKQTKLDLPIITKPSQENGKKGKKNEYDKTLIVTLVIKSSKDIKWDELSKQVDKTPTQCKDIWRKVIQPSLLTNKPWANDGKGWTKEMKIMTLITVLESCNADWETMISFFPGKSKSQLKDIWRKVILTRLQRGDTIE